MARMTDADMGAAPSEPNPQPTSQRLTDADMNAAPGNPVAAIGTTPDTPDKGDLYGGGAMGNWNRFRSSFGDPKGISTMLASRGLKNPQKNKDGDMVAQSTDGRWYKDAQGLTNPVNWAEGHAGKAIPLAGMGLGAVGGAMAGAATTPVTGPAAPAIGYGLGVAGAGVGGGIGEGARVGIGKVLGSNQGDYTPQVEGEAKQSAIAEAIGKPVGAAIGMIPGVKPAANWVADRTIRPLMAGASKAMSLGGVDYDAAKRLLQNPADVMGATAPENIAAVGSQAAKEVGVTDGTIGQNAKDVQQAVRGPMKGVRVNTDYETNKLDEAMNNYKPNRLGVGPLGDPNESKQSLKILQGWQDLLDKGDSDSESTQTFRSLQKTAKYLSDYGQPSLEATGDNTFKTPQLQSVASHVAGSLKQKLHELSPELADSDATSTAWANGKELLKGFENPATSEAKASSLFGNNKVNMQAAAQKYIPNAYEGLANIGANKSFGQGDVLQKFGGPTARAITLLGAGGLGALAGHPLGMLAGGALAAGSTLTSPMIQKQLLNMGGRIVNGQLPSLAYKSLGPWGLMNSEGDK